MRPLATLNFEEISFQHMSTTNKYGICPIDTVNFDGADKGNTGKVGVGGVFKDSIGLVIP